MWLIWLIWLVLLFINSNITFWLLSWSNIFRRFRRDRTQVLIAIDKTGRGREELIPVANIVRARTALIFHAYCFVLFFTQTPVWTTKFEPSSFVQLSRLTYLAACKWWPGTRPISRPRSPATGTRWFRRWNGRRRSRAPRRPTTIVVATAPRAPRTPGTGRSRAPVRAATDTAKHGRSITVSVKTRMTRSEGRDRRTAPPKPVHCDHRLRVVPHLNWPPRQTFHPFPSPNGRPGLGFESRSVSVLSLGAPNNDRFERHAKTRFSKTLRNQIVSGLKKKN